VSEKSIAPEEPTQSKRGQKTKSVAVKSSRGITRGQEEEEEEKQTYKSLAVDEPEVIEPVKESKGRKGKKTAASSKLEEPEETIAEAQENHTEPENTETPASPIKRGGRRKKVTPVEKPSPIKRRGRRGATKEEVVKIVDKSITAVVESEDIAQNESSNDESSESATVTKNKKASPVKKPSPVKRRGRRGVTKESATETTTEKTEVEKSEVEASDILIYSESKKPLPVKKASPVKRRGRRGAAAAAAEENTVVEAVEITSTKKPARRGKASKEVSTEQDEISEAKTVATPKPTPGKRSREDVEESEPSSKKTKRGGRNVTFELSPEKTPAKTPQKPKRGKKVAEKSSPVKEAFPEKKESPVKKAATKRGRAKKETPVVEEPVATPKKSPVKATRGGRAAAKKASQNISKNVEELSNLAKKKRRPSAESTSGEEPVKPESPPAKKTKRAAAVKKEESPVKRTTRSRKK